MVDYPIGDLIAERVRAMGVQPFYKRFEHDGVRGPNMATVYSDRGHGVRAPVVFYNRSNEAAACSSRATSTGRRSSRAACAGSTAAASSRRSRATTAELIIEGMKAAKAAGAVVLVRPELPREAVEDLGRRRARGRGRSARIVENVDVLVGNEEDLQKGLGIPGPEVAAEVEARSRAPSSG